MESFWRSDAHFSERWPENRARLSAGNYPGLSPALFTKVGKTRRGKKACSFIIIVESAKKWENQVGGKGGRGRKARISVDYLLFVCFL